MWALYSISLHFLIINSQHPASSFIDALGGEGPTRPILCLGLLLAFSVASTLLLSTQMQSFFFFLCFFHDNEVCVLEQ